MAARPYDVLAPHYARYARRRASYCDAIDRLVLEWAPARVGAMLDVGSGDGGRAVRLAAALSASHLVLSDPSAPMAALCRARREAADVWPCAAEDLPAGPMEFDIITCLWSVLGLVEGTERRIAALERMAARLAPEGRLVLDVHNRYDAAAASTARVVARWVRDLARPADTNGTVRVVWDIDGRRIESRGYLFAPAEMDRLCTAAGLRVVHRAFVNYATGAAGGPLSGQMLFVLSRAAPG